MVWTSGKVPDSFSTAKRLNSIKTTSAVAEREGGLIWLGLGPSLAVAFLIFFAASTKTRVVASQLRTLILDGPAGLHLLRLRTKGRRSSSTDRRGDRRLHGTRLLLSLGLRKIARHRHRLRPGGHHRDRLVFGDFDAE